MGVLGTGYRIFRPIFAQEKQIGIVCVGLTDKSISKVIRVAQRSVVIGSLVALIIGILLALLIARHIKKRCSTWSQMKLHLSSQNYMLLMIVLMKRLSWLIIKNFNYC
ncbi:hypothetical protein SDC49_10345 [Lactobacillus sp. R2/2]|nr:hypothetical protein [Lactobacillus sp. R2/2]